jgi:hypothetical protein
MRGVLPETQHQFLAMPCGGVRMFDFVWHLLVRDTEVASSETRSRCAATASGLVGTREGPNVPSKVIENLFSEFAVLASTVLGGAAA